MYEAFYKLHTKPFSLLPDPAFLYLSEKHRMALSVLEYGLSNQAGFTVITGDIGTGKTTLIRQLLNHIANDTTVGLITNTHRHFGELLRWILLAFNMDHVGDDQVELYRAFVDFMIDEYAHNRRTVLIIDEAQNLSQEALEELQTLSNVNADENQLLQIMLVGRPELRDTLCRPDLAQFAQRIAADYRLTPLEVLDTREYIRHRLEAGGGRRELFEDAACAVVHHYSSGIPRLINLLCDAALVYGFADQCETINEELVTDVACDKQKGGMFPAAKTTAQPREASTPAQVHILASPPRQAPATLSPLNNSSDSDLEENKLRILLGSDSQELRDYLSHIFQLAGHNVIGAIPLNATKFDNIDRQSIDVLFLDVDEDGTPEIDWLLDQFTELEIPTLVNDAQDTRASLEGKKPEFSAHLARKLKSLTIPHKREQPKSVLL